MKTLTQQEKDFLTKLVLAYKDSIDFLKGFRNDYTNDELIKIAYYDKLIKK